jgi:G3E family GTPase
VRGSLAPVLKNLRMAWDADNHYFERVIIETSGAANPEPILDILLKDRWLSARYSLQAAITTVSAIMDERNFKRFPEVAAQIAFADTVLLTQTDLADAWQQKQIQAKLGQLAPAATHLIAVQGEIDPNVLFKVTKPFRHQRGDGAAAIPGHTFNTITVKLTTPIPSQRLHTALTYLTTHYSAQLVRLKGLVYTTEQNQPLMVHCVAAKLYPPSQLPHRSSDDGIGRLVVIYTGEIPGLAESILKHLYA